MLYGFDGRKPGLGRDVYISDQAVVIGDVKIGNGYYVGSGAIVHARTIGDLAVVGMGAVLSLGVEVGEKAIVAEGTVVRTSQKVPAGVVAAGNPATVIRNVTPEDEERWKSGKQLYINLAKKYLEIGLQPINKSGSAGLRTPSRRRLEKSK